MSLWQISACIHHKYFKTKKGKADNFDATDITDSRIAALIEGITFSITDTGNEDGPWEWEGEPFSAEPASAQAGSLTVSSTFVPFEAPVTTFETFDHSVAAIGDRVYVLVDGELRECHYDGTCTYGSVCF